MQQQQANNNLPNQGFRTTRWTLVDAASDNSREALEELCSLYWNPIYSYVRRLGNNSADAEDLTQAFFSRLIDKKLLSSADHTRGTFRTFLITSLRRFLINEWKHHQTTKRGGQLKIVPLQADPSIDAWVASVDLTPDRSFDRRWAIELMGRAFSLLEAEQKEAGNGTLFERLIPTLACEIDAPKYAELALELQVSAASLRMTVSRLRQRLGDLIRAEVRSTVTHDDDVEQELRDLFSALAS